MVTLGCFGLVSYVYIDIHTLRFSYHKFSCMSSEIVWYKVSDRIEYQTVISPG